MGSRLVVGGVPEVGALHGFDPRQGRAALVLSVKQQVLLRPILSVYSATAESVPCAYVI